MSTGHNALCDQSLRSKADVTTFNAKSGDAKISNKLSLYIHKDNHHIVVKVKNR